MNKYRIIFSPTGGTEKVANAITKSWDTVKDIDLSRTDLDYSSISLTKEDIAVIAMPSFGGVAPQLALDRLAKIGGNQCKCTIVAYAVKAGVHVIAAVSAVAEHSILHQYATGRPDENDSKQLTEFGNQILEKAGSGNESTPNIPGNRPYKESSAGLVPKANASCSACGLCADKCPAGAIDRKNPRMTDKSKCISCMRCVAVCPKHARKVSGFMTAVAGMAIKKACSVRKECELFL